MKSVVPVVEAAGVKAGIVAQLVASEHAAAQQPADAQLLGGTGEPLGMFDGVGLWLSCCVAVVVEAAGAMSLAQLTRPERLLLSSLHDPPEGFLFEVVGWADTLCFDQ